MHPLNFKPKKDSLLLYAFFSSNLKKLIDRENKFLLIEIKIKRVEKMLKFWTESSEILRFVNLAHPIQIIILKNNQVI